MDDLPVGGQFERTGDIQRAPDILLLDLLAVSLDAGNAVGRNADDAFATDADDGILHLHTGLKFGFVDDGRNGFQGLFDVDDGTAANSFAALLAE